MIAFRYWLRNLFTDDDGVMRGRAVAIGPLVTLVAILGAAAALTFAFRSMPATAPQPVTVVVNNPGDAPVTVVVQP